MKTNMVLVSTVRNRHKLEHMFNISFIRLTSGVNFPTWLSSNIHAEVQLDNLSGTARTCDGSCVHLTSIGYKLRNRVPNIKKIWKVKTSPRKNKCCRII